ncbi:MAG: DUF1883 domain-containing protein [Planctomycetes bacterium]|nr:DUF1883 domain-containing protein [Planctomycetota bacterium]
MNYLHQELDAGPSDVIEVTLDHAANVLLLDASNYGHYRSNRPYRYYGGHARSSPARITPPRQGRWHLVIDLGGYPGTVRASVRLLAAAPHG